MAFSSEVDTGSLKENASNKNLKPGSGSIRTERALDRDLRPNLDDAARGDLEIVGRIIGGSAQGDEKMVLPARHAGMGRRLQRAARQEERSRHDVELPAELARDRQRL